MFGLSPTVSAYVAAGGCALLMVLVGGLGTPIGPWYRALKKPALQPPDWAFGPAWTVILTCWAASLGTAWLAASPEQQVQVAIVYGVNAVLFAIWSPIFFRLRRPDWALIEIVPFWISIAVTIWVVAPISSTAAWLLLPYLLWVSFASWLNWQIVRLNSPFGAAEVPERAAL